ncbi:hypothetical protein DSUL_50378 [Desulfovibrionales bacterium]
MGSVTGYIDFTTTTSGFYDAVHDEAKYFIADLDHVKVGEADGRQKKTNSF